MVANLVHFGVDLAFRTPVLQSAGFQVGFCSSIDSLIEALEREQVDAVVVPQRPGLQVDSAVGVARSCPSTSVILFVEEPGQPYDAQVDLVIPLLTPPHEWLINIAELVAQSKVLQAESQSLRAQASILRSESCAARQRVVEQCERAMEIRKHFPRNSK